MAMLVTVLGHDTAPRLHHEVPATLMPEGLGLDPCVLSARVDDDVVAEIAAVLHDRTGSGDHRGVLLVGVQQAAERP